MTPHGQPLSRSDRERIWLMVWRGVRSFKVIANYYGLSVDTVRQTVFDGCCELVERLREDRQFEKNSDWDERH